MDDHTQKQAHVRDMEHPVLNHGLVTDLVQALRPPKLVAIYGKGQQ